jgi:hypothetical protein
VASAAESWPALDRWSDDYLVERAGNGTVRLGINPIVTLENSD